MSPRRIERHRIADRSILAPYQLDAADLLLNLLEFHGGALLADEIGLGKSYIAAALARDRARDGISSTFVVPASLTGQWRGVLARFSLECEIVSHEALIRRDAPLPGTGHGLVIIDEAHRFRDPSTLKYRAIAGLSVGRQLLLVTATPICNKLDDLHAILQLAFADDAFRIAGVLSMDSAFAAGSEEAIESILSSIMIRRGRGVLPRTFQCGSIRKRIVRYSFGSERLFELVKSLRFPLTDAMPLLRLGLLRRLESSPAAFLDSIQRQRRFYRRALEMAAAGRALTRRDFHLIDHRDDDTGYQELLFPQLWLAPRDLAAVSLAELQSELICLDEIRSMQLTDSKAASLIGELSGQTWDAESILIFTGAIATALDLHQRLAPWAPAVITSRYAAILRGHPIGADAILASFRSGGIRMLIVTDLASEGLNLQRASQVIHYDLPWNPVKLDQRNGRVSRIGQERSEIDVLYFVADRRLESSFIETLANKNRIRARYLGSPRAGGSRTEARIRPALDSEVRIRVGPASVSRGSSQWRFARAARTRRLLDSVLRALLARRYRAGAEVLIGDMAGEYLDSARVALLVNVLTRELEITGGQSERVARHREAFLTAGSEAPI